MATDIQKAEERNLQGEWGGIERRVSRRDGSEPRRRRLRDRLEGEGEVTLSPALSRKELRNPGLLCDDDLRQTAKSLEGIERFLLKTARVLAKPDLVADDVEELLSEDMDEQVDGLIESLGSLQRSLRVIANKL